MAASPRLLCVVSPRTREQVLRYTTLNRMSISAFVNYAIRRYLAELYSLEQLTLFDHE